MICSCDNTQGVLLIAPVVKSTETTLLCFFMSYSFSDGRESTYFVPTPTRNQRVTHCHLLALLSGQSFTLRRSSVGFSFQKMLFVTILPLFKLFEFSAEKVIVFVLVTTRPFVSPFNNIGKGKTFQSVAPLPTNFLKKVLREPYLSANPKSFSAASSNSALYPARISWTFV